MSEEELHHRVPPGFRFHPTDEELINYYLKKKVASGKFDLDHVIREVDLNKLEPWDLREKCKVDASHQTEWYFFSHKDKKYPTGTRTNRATKAGFWKATGRDKAVFSSSSLSHGGQQGGRIGMRKTLVFYKGRAPHGLKTDWIMHEYRLQDSDLNNHASSKHTNEDGWVVCRVFKKRNYEEKSSSTSASSFDQSNSNLSDEEQLPAGEGSQPAPKTEKSRKQQAETISNAAIISTNNIALISCKQELVEDPAPQSATTFLQLPQLESPKMGPNPDIINTAAADNPNANASDLNRALPTEGGQKPPQILQCANHLEMQQEAINGKAFFMTEEDLDHYIIGNSNGQMADYNYHWSLNDNLARYHGIDNFAGDQFFPQFTAHLTRIQQPVDNSPSTCEIELWNFPR